MFQNFTISRGLFSYPLRLSNAYMSPDRLNKWWYIVNLTLRNTFQSHIWNSEVLIQEYAFENIICKMVAILFQPQCVNGDGISYHYSDIIMGVIISQITSLTIVYSTIYSDAGSKKASKLRTTGLCAGNSPVTGLISQKTPVSVLPSLSKIYESHGSTTLWFFWQNLLCFAVSFQKDIQLSVHPSEYDRAFKKIAGQWWICGMLKRGPQQGFWLSSPLLNNL